MRSYPTLAHQPSRDRLAHAGRESRRSGGTVAEARTVIAGLAAQLARDAARFPGFLAHVHNVSADPTEAFELAIAATSSKGQHEPETPFRPHVDSPFFPSSYIAYCDGYGKAQDGSDYNAPRWGKRTGGKSNHHTMKQTRYIPRHW